MAYWGCAQLQPNRTAVALHHLALAGYEVYHPRLRQQRVSHSRRVLVTPPLFPGYAFIHIVAQWYTARWAPGVVRLILDGVQPARVPDAVVSEIKSHEIDGLIELLKPPLRRGARVKILRGPFRDHLAIFADMKPHERVEVLLELLGGERRVTLAQEDVAAIK
jgi:transcriptional antiterminator RfaH